mgnify:CR=1 FL=1
MCAIASLVFLLRVPGTFVSDQKDELDRPLLTFAEEAGVSLVRVSTLAALVNYIEGLDADQHRIERACVLKGQFRVMWWWVWLSGCDSAGCGSVLFFLSCPLHLMSYGG